MKTYPMGMYVSMMRVRCVLTGQKMIIAAISGKCIGETNDKTLISDLCGGSIYHAATQRRGLNGKQTDRK